jgi:hypothetical protein
MNTDYKPPEKTDGESNWDWCRRYAASIPPEVLLHDIMKAMHANRKRRRYADPLWAQIGKLTGHGSGVSTAIVNHYYPE